ncbi:YadA C-terminal domain-containing protein [Sphingomonas asaccharolytica]|uniref:YadA C-terminal domain-containing protein n=1 Tax=Sphingomonas asaccharolytica TaxID=40681 RepID=UPI00082CC982|nr:YadA C-terminal domain-containing protein [Sphingomonas asaccharolytica]
MIGLVSAVLASLLIAAPAAAQVRFTENFIEGFQAVCLDDGELAIPEDDDCKTGLVGHDFDAVVGVYTGTPDNHSFLKSNGDAEFDGQVDFYKSTTFHGPVTFAGTTNFTAATLGTTTINNTGLITTGGIHVTSGSQFDGPAIFNGAVNSQFLFTGSAQTITLTATGASKLLGGATVDKGLAVTGGTTSDTLTVTTALTAAPGATVDMGGNRVQNVGTPIAGTDAANKDYVDTAVSGVQGNVTALTNQVAGQATRITAVENVNNVQDTRLTAIENVNSVQDTRLGAVETENTVQNTRLTSVENVNAGQDARMTAIEAVNTTQSNQISTLQGQVGSLQTSVKGLRRNIKEANAGIAAAVALGGTMIVPDSAVSVSFNLATYRGQQGFSGSLVGRVNPRIYVNAGVAASTVRGSTTGRVGISFGL